MVLGLLSSALVHLSGAVISELCYRGCVAFSHGICASHGAALVNFNHQPDLHPAGSWACLWVGLIVNCYRRAKPLCSLGSLGKWSQIV